MLEVRVDYNRCTGHGLCELEAEDVFEVGSDGVVHVQTDHPGEEHREQIKSAAAVCPTAALTLLG
ncbi:MULTISPECIES: ferredoxin [Actinomycetospora]|uniref:Ferredoxin n=1 Tax=Actinomycetospora termitidis TaxID=3053470 RepID=A0ABT7MID6_9PSEU|nr:MULTISPECIES: ferredoxin [Actinomycetospora]MCD2191550.1 ferredoxin [Actinomycetospora soli]MDL5160449.1 ferredoxin [Actinomycetospora sp. Odt1-22]